MQTSPYYSSIFPVFLPGKYRGRSFPEEGLNVEFLKGFQALLTNL